MVFDDFVLVIYTLIWMNISHGFSDFVASILT